MATPLDIATATSVMIVFSRKNVIAEARNGRMLPEFSVIPPPSPW